MPSASARKIQRMLKEQRRKTASPEAIEAAQKIVENLRARFQPAGENETWEALAALIEENAKDAQGVAAIRRIAKAELDQLTEGWHPEAEMTAREMLATWSRNVAMRPKLSFDNPIVKLFDAIAEAKGRDTRTWFVSIEDMDSLTFGSDNWIHLKAYALTQGDSPSVKGITIRRRELNPSNQPPWRATLSGMVAAGTKTVLLSAEEVLSSHTTSARTGEPIDADPACSYVGTAELLPALAFQVDPDLFSGPKSVQ